MTGLEIAFSVCNLIATALAAVAAVRSASAAERSVESANKSVVVAEASEKAAQRSADAAKEQVGVALLQKQLAQRQFVIQLWDRMCDLKPINPADPAPVDVHRASNTLELIGLCCEGGMIDVDVIKRTFRERYVQMYDWIKACGPMASLSGKNGVELLRENPAAMNFYNELMDELKNAGKLTRT